MNSSTFLRRSLMMLAGIALATGITVFFLNSWFNASLLPALGTPQLRRAGGLEPLAHRAAVARIEREQVHLEPGLGAQQPRRLQPVHPRHLHVHQHQVVAL